MEILVSANLPKEAAAALESVVVDFLKSHGAEVCLFHSTDYAMVRGCSVKPTLDTVIAADEPSAPVEPEASPEVDAPSPPAELTSSEGPVASLDEPIPADEPIVAVAPPLVGEVCLKDLSSQHAVPFVVDLTKQFTELKVKELRDLGDHVSFVYMGMVFKFPVPPSINGVVNSPIPPTSTAIRCMVEFVDFGIDLQPVLFNLVECAGDEQHSVVFGADMSEIVSGLEKKVPSEVQPA